jgi:ring-1,2-phenylacetyl-CoA epoxidase subunit PaaE
MSTAFHTLTIGDIQRETADSLSLNFIIPDALRDIFAFRPGQHLTLRADIDGEDVRRNYSLCVAPHEGIVKVAIKQITQGLFSNWAAATLKAGDIIEVMPPHGSFTVAFDAANTRHYVGFAGGAGITPILSLLKTALEIEPNSHFTLFYGNRDSSSIMFGEELAQIKNRYMARFTLFHFLSDECEDIDLLNGQLDQDKCSEILDNFIDVHAISDYFICGPAPMMDAVEAALKSRNVASSRIHNERFTAGIASPRNSVTLAEKSAKASGTIMTLTLDGRTRKLVFDGSAGNILDSARQSGMPAPYACKAGVCATCRARVVTGKVTMAARYGLSDEEVASGYILTCQAIPDGDGLIIDYDG